MDTGGITSSQGLVPMQGVHGHGHHQMRAKVESAVADKLGMSVDDLRSQLSSGKSMTDVAASKGVSKDDLVSTIAGVLQANGPGQATTSSTSSTSQAGAPDLTEMATRIADRVGGGRHGQGASASLRSSLATTSAADLVAQLSQAGQGAPAGGDPDGDGDGGGGSFNVRL